VVLDGALSSIADVPRKSTLLEERSNPAVYVMQGAQKCPIPSEHRFEELGFAWGDICVVSDGALDRISVGPAV